MILIKEMEEKKQNLSKIAFNNSLYSLAFAIINKIGGLVFTIILARILLPDLFGLYSLALSVVVIAITLTDVGINFSGIRYMSKALINGNKTQARSFFRYLLKIKSLLALMLLILIIIFAKPLSQSVFNKPLLFVPLLFSSLYLFVESIRNFFTVPFSAKKDLKSMLPSELLSQVSKIIFALIILSVLSYELKVSGVFVVLVISSILSLSLLSFFLIKKYPDLILGPIVTIDKKKVLKYMGYMGITGITTIFFGSIDTLILGRFVDASYLGYYRVALGLVLSISGLLPFSGVLLPIFTQINGKRLDRGFTKSLRYLILLSIPMAVGLMFIAKYVLFLIYGEAYLPASPVLLILSPLIIIAPLVALYSTVFQAKEKPEILAKFILFSLIINIILNYILIKLLLNISQEYALIGASIATLISNIFLLNFLIIKTKSKFKIKLERNIIIKPVIATGIMALFLFVYNAYIDISIFSGLFEVLLGVVVYFGSLILIKGATKDDWRLLYSLLNRQK